MKIYILVFILAVSCSFSQWKTSSWNDELPIIGLQFEGDKIAFVDRLGNLKYSTNNGISFDEKSIPIKTIEFPNSYIDKFILSDSVIVFKQAYSDNEIIYSINDGNSWEFSTMKFEKK